MDRIDLEEATGRLFGDFWAPFDDGLFDHSLDLFGQRLKIAGLNDDWLVGKVCLDAGCGGGRNAIAMTKLGASRVHGIDLGKNGIVDAKKRAADLGLSNLEFEQASILDIPASDSSFDLVWCAGVLMITDNADEALDELIRVLKPGGHLYLLVYATEGLRWPLIQSLRPIANAIGQEKMEDAFVRSQLPANKRRTFFDDLYCPRLDFYDWSRLKQMLETRGMTSIERWGNKTRLDHEQSLEDYHQDLSELLCLFQAGSADGNMSSSQMFELGAEMVGAILKTVNHAIHVAHENESRLSDMEQLVIGQGHHRVLAVKL